MNDPAITDCPQGPAASTPASGCVPEKIVEAIHLFAFWTATDIQQCDDELKCRNLTHRMQVLEDAIATVKAHNAKLTHGANNQ